MSYAPSCTTGCRWSLVPRRGRNGLGRSQPTLANSRPCFPPAEEMTCSPVSARVGNVKNNDPSLIEPVAPA